jgi:hypothetical protein
VEVALRYCALHQLQIHQTYSDDGVSGTVPGAWSPPLQETRRAQTRGLSEATDPASPNAARFVL